MCIDFFSLVQPGLGSYPPVLKVSCSSGWSSKQLFGSAGVGRRPLVGNGGCSSNSGRAFAVVDCGTAITVDAVSSDGDFLRWCDQRRPATSLRALTDSVKSPSGGYSRVRRGAEHQYRIRARIWRPDFAVGGIERALLEFDDTLGGDLHVVLTGGDSWHRLPL